jgi:hypothetical protein
LNSGEKIGPTSERGVFVFRFSYIKRLGIFRRAFDVEIADFPGEYSQQLTDEKEEFKIEKVAPKAGRKRAQRKKPSSTELRYTLLNREFFSWIASSREYLFIIDLASIYSAANGRAAVADIKARIRTSWQVIEDATAERGIGSSRNRPVRVIFTKVDSLLPAYESKISLDSLLYDKHIDESVNRQLASNVEALKEEIGKRGNANDLTRKTILQADFMTWATSENARNFADLHEFFHARVRHADDVYVSMTLTDEDGNRFGVKNLLRTILP